MSVDDEKSCRHDKQLERELHDRARVSAIELFKLEVSLSIGTVAALFVVATTNIEPRLSRMEVVSVLSALISMSLSLLLGLSSWYSDARRYYLWATALKREGEERNRFYRLRDRWERIRRTTSILMAVSFTIGVVAVVVYIYLRTVAGHG